MIDFLILTSDPAQSRAIESKFQHKSSVHVQSHERDFDVSELHSSEEGGPETKPKVLLAELKDRGRAKAAIEMFSMLSVLKPRVILFVGLATGIKGKVDLGDIVVSSRINELTPSVVLGKGEYDIHSYSTGSERLKDYIKFHITDWKYTLPKSSLRFSPTACTSILTDSLDLNLRNQKVTVIDMESAGIAAAVEALAKRPEFLAIFCVSDFMDSSKSESAASAARDTAAAFSAALVRGASSVSDKSHLPGESFSQ
jgi:purine-nucleoside phosphorylase